MIFSARSYFLCFVQITAFTASLVIFALQGAAQTLPSDPNVDNGTHWYGSYDGVHENVSLSSGNVSFCIPLVSLPGRANHNLSIPLCYNSQFQEAGPVSNDGSLVVRDTLAYFPWLWAPNAPSGDTTPPMGPGWALSGAPAYYSSFTTSNSSYPVEFMPDGARYSFPDGATTGASAYGPDGQNADIFATTSSGSSMTVLMKDGTSYTTNWTAASASTCPANGCGTEQFTDGNTISWTNSSVTDTIGRT